NKSQEAGADGLALNIVEGDGVITSISGSIAANTYDAYGAAAAVQGNTESTVADIESAVNTLGAIVVADTWDSDVTTVLNTTIPTEE
ncbi:MAG: hypothetical protein MJ158_03135, partial [Alphaproteobacteria bacterium]|nr:hypothetical protein [Alphaproteobacteria bacterium]